MGGNFTTINSTTRKYLAKVDNSTGALDGTWLPNPNSSIYQIITDGSNIYAGGNFTTIGGETRNYIAKLNTTNGSANSTWNPNANNRVKAISIDGSDLYVGGWFTAINSATRNFIAKIDLSTGTVDGTWNPNANDEVSTIAIDGSDIYVGGSFSAIGGLSNGYLVKLNNTTGAANASWAPNPVYDGLDAPFISSITIDGSDIYVGGNYLIIDGKNNPYFSLFVSSLPVELTSFTASTISESVVLDWQTATEINNYGFEVQRSVVSNQISEFETIGFVDGHGNSNSPNNYSFIDSDNLIGTVKYRLKQLDIDGAFEYSDVVTVELNGKLEYKLAQNHPNPFNPTTQISFTIPKAGVVKLSVYNLLGEVVTELVNTNLEAGSHQYQFNANNLTSGIYFYSISVNGFTEVKKMNLIK
jgi:hypothetical protein